MPAEASMARPHKLGEPEIAERLRSLHGWTIEAGKLRRVLVFRDFAEAFGFMASCALVAKRLDHHPDWSNVYKTVRIDLSTHDAGGITALDFELAARIDALAERWGRPAPYSGRSWSRCGP